MGADVTINLNLRDPEGTSDETVITQHLLGLDPYVLIRGEVTGDGDEESLVLNIEGAQTNLEALEDLCSLIKVTLEENRGLEPVEDRIRSVLEAHGLAVPKDLLRDLREAVDA